MCRTRCMLALVALYVALVQSWDIAATNGDLLEFYSNRIKINYVRFNSKNLTALVYAQNHNMILFVDKQSGNDVICSYDISAMEKKCVTERSGRNIHGLAYDPVTEKLFFSDTLERSINWISVKRGFVNNIYGNLLHRTSLGIPTDLAVDSCRGYVYWITTNLTPPRIERARFDGSGRQVIVTSVSLDSPHKQEPHSLVIDQQTQKMYWLEPKTGLEYHVYSAGLNGESKQTINSLLWPSSTSMVPQPSASTLTVSKKSLYLVGWCSDCTVDVWEIPKGVSTVKSYGNFSLHTVGAKGGIIANYSIEENLPEIEDCEPVTSLVRNNCDQPFCVHGAQVRGQPRCKCTPGYVGERCDVSVCYNYCMQGDCSSNDEGLPQCRCNADYSGNRCEVKMVVY